MVTSLAEVICGDAPVGIDGGVSDPIVELADSNRTHRLPKPSLQEFAHQWVEPQLAA